MHWVWFYLLVKVGLLLMCGGGRAKAEKAYEKEEEVTTDWRSEGEEARQRKWRRRRKVQMEAACRYNGLISTSTCMESK